MSQTHTIGRTGPRVVREGEDTVVYYHGTPVVRFDATRITLRTNGWYTATTKTRTALLSRSG